MDIRKPQFAADGQAVDCEVRHPDLGWLPFTATADDTDPSGQEVWAAVQEQEIAPAPIPPHAVQREAALVRIRDVHADFLRQSTGHATVEERDTWKPKEEAARALIAGSATDGQTTMLQFEAEGGGTDLLVLAQIVVAKAEAFQALIGIAAGIKAKAKSAIMQATDETVPVEQVGPALEALFAQLPTEADAAVAQWRGQTEA